jgi:hypothetical protein
LLGVSGRITKNGRSGSNSFNFNGKIGGRNLSAAGYQLTAAPAGGTSQKATFRIVG